jgi:hypothetical protein
MTLARGDVGGCSGRLRGWAALTLALAALLSASATQAQAAAPRAQPSDDVELRVSTDQPGASIDVETWEHGRAAAGGLRFHCEHDCMLRVPAARYRLVLHRPDPDPGSADETVVVRVQDSVMFRSAAPNHRTSAGVGMALTIVGAALLVSGLASLAYAALSQICEEQGCGAPSGFALYGITAAISGTAIGLLGLLVWSSHKAAFDREPLPAPRLRAGIGPAPLGFRGYLSVAF